MSKKCKNQFKKSLKKLSRKMLIKNCLHLDRITSDLAHKRNMIAIELWNRTNQLERTEKALQSCEKALQEAHDNIEHKDRMLQGLVNS